MLSFMREQGYEDAIVENKPKASNSDAKKGGAPNPSKKADEKTEEQQYLTVASKGKNVRKMTVMLAVLFVIGLLGLWFMIKKSTPQTATAASSGKEETQIAKAIKRLTGVGSEMFNRMDQIVKKFYEFSDVGQVRVNELVKNPFEHHDFLADTEESTDTKDSITETELIKQQRVKEKIKNMPLLAICKTDEGNCCMIEDKILYEGDTIKGFTVRQVSDTFVKLEFEGVETVLKLSK